MSETASNTKIIEISAKQFLLLLVTYVISTADVFLPAFVAQEAKEDSWISVIIGTIGALIIANIFITLGLRYPKKTIIQYASDIVGIPIGKIIGFSYAYYFIFVAWAVTRELEEIFVTAFNPDAPIILYGIVTVIVAAYAVMNGLEVIARINELLLPIGLIVLFGISLLNIPNVDLTNFLPVFYNGIIPSLKGGLFVQTWLIETVITLMLIPYIKEKEKARKYLNFAILILGGTLIVGASTIAVFGVSLTEKFLFPALEYVRYASLGPNIQNLDMGIMLVWITGIYIKIALSYFVGVLALTQVIGSRSYKRLMVPIGIIIIVFASASARMLIELIYSIKYILPFYFLVIALIIPSILLLISVIRKQKSS